jgi:hypothetical protein
MNCVLLSRLLPSQRRGQLKTGVGGIGRLMLRPLISDKRQKPHRAR